MSARHFLALLLCLAAVAPDIVHARCWGANGYCTKRERARLAEVDRAAEIAALSKHQHPNWRARIADHARLAELTAR